MNLVRLIIIALVIWLVVRMLRRYLDKPTPSSNDRGATPKKIVRCAHCGLHIPEAEAVHSAGRDYCSLEHSTADKH